MGAVEGLRVLLEGGNLDPGMRLGAVILEQRRNRSRPLGVVLERGELATHLPQDPRDGDRAEAAAELDDALGPPTADLGFDKCQRLAG